LEHTTIPLCRGIATDLAKDIDLESTDERESMHFDLLITGAGPAGLSAAIKFKQLCTAQDKDLTVCVIEKGAELGSHILSGNVFEPRSLDELLPDWRDDPDCPVPRVPVSKDKFYFYTPKHSIRLPTPSTMKNKGTNYIISLSETVKWLGSRAEALGVDIYPGFAGSKIIFNPDRSAVKGIITNDMGIAKDGTKKDSFTLGMALTAGATLFAEGCRGSLSQEVIKHFNLADAVGACPQTYALGIKEVWQIQPEKHKQGTVIHGLGWPLPWNTYGGMWLYHWDEGRVSLGLVTALDYKNPHINLYQEFQQLKRHPSIAKLLEGGTCLQYGARTLVEGGWQSLPATGFEGGAVIGDAAGTLNVPKIKGTHTAMKSGMIAAELAFHQLISEKHMAHAEVKKPVDLTSYTNALRESWVGDELRAVRNVRPSFNLGAGVWGGMAYSALDGYLLKGKGPWTFRHKRADHEALLPAAECSTIEYPKPDGVTTFDIPTSLFRSGTIHDHDQPIHLRLRNPKIPEAVNLKIYGGPERGYCPAGVYEYVAVDDDKDEEKREKTKKKGGGGGGKEGEEEENTIGNKSSTSSTAGVEVSAIELEKMQLQINAQNCLHCKACDIKDPLQNIHWTVPEGGGGPSYTMT